MASDIIRMGNRLEIVKGREACWFHNTELSRTEEADIFRH